MSRASMRDVELLEADAPRPSDATPARRLRWAAAALVVVVACAAVVVQHRGDVRAQERTARLESVAGVLAPLDGPPAVRWWLDPTVAPVTFGRPADGVLLGGASVEGDVELHGVDVATGTVLWRTAVQVRPDEVLWTWCDPVSTSGGGQLAVCAAGADGPAAADGLSSRTVWTVVPRTGKVLTTWTLRGDATLLVTADQLVVAARERGDVWTVRSLDPATADPRWTFTPTIPNRQTGVGQPQLVDDGAGRVLLSLADHAWLLDKDGHPVLDRSTPPGTWWVALRAGSLLGRTFPRGSVPGGIAVLPGAAVVPLAEQPVRVFPDDGTAPDVVLTLDIAGAAPVLVARSARSGAILWRHPGDVLSALLVDGTLYLGTPDGLAALDARTGTARWERELEQGVDTMSTDGDELVVLAPPATLAAYALHDGSPTWSSDVSVLPGAGAGGLASLELAPGSRAFVAWGRDGSATVLG